MTTGRDDDALSWDGDDDPTLDTGASPEGPRENGTEPAEAALPPGFTAVGRGSDRVVAADDDRAIEPSRPQPEQRDDMTAKNAMGSVELVAIGVLGGIYALFAIGWIIGGVRLQARLLLNDPMFLASLWLAVLAPLLWFATVYLLTRASRRWVRFAWLAVGAVLLVPWPFVLLGSVA